MKRRSARGMTLIELMMAIAIASIVILTATMAAASMFRLSQGQARQTQAEAQVALSIAALDRAFASAGAGFGNARYAFRVRNNVNAGTNVLGLTAVTFGSNASGVVAGTDVIELSTGDPAYRHPGFVQSGGTLDNSTTTVQLRNADPLSDQEWADATAAWPSPFVLFTRDSVPRESCLAKVTAVNAGTRTLTVTVLNDNYGTTSPTCAVPRNNDDVLVYKLETRERFFIYQTANGTDFGLYRQEANTYGDFDGGIRAVALGIENMQVAPILGEEFDGGSLAVTSCTAYDGGFCNCGFVPSGGDCAVGEAGGLDTNAAPTALNSLVRGATVEFLARGERSAEARAPVSLDQPLDLVDGGYRRVQGQASFRLYNSFMATQ